MRAIKSLKESVNFTHLEEYTASRALEEESEKQSYEFLKLFVCGSIKLKEEKRRNHSKIATWEDEQEKGKVSKAQGEAPPSKPSLNREINYARRRLIRRKVEKMHTESTDYHSKYNKEDHEVQKQPIFSISLLNPKIEEEGVRSQEKIRAKAKIPTNFMNYLVTPPFEDKKKQKIKGKNARVHSLKHSDKDDTENNNKMPFLDLNNSQLPDAKPSSYLNARIESAAAVSKFYKKSPTTSGLQQLKTPIKMDHIVKRQRRSTSLDANPQLKRSVEFQKLRRLLNLQKL